MTANRNLLNPEKPCYVYSNCDGNENGMFLGLTLNEAKEIAKATHAALVESGETDTAVQVLDRTTGNYICGFGATV